MDSRATALFVELGQSPQAGRALRKTNPGRAAQWLYQTLGAFQRVRARNRAIAIAIALVLPTLATGFVFDDYVLLYELGRPRGHEWTGSAPLDLFRWLDPAHYTRLVDGEGIAWWTWANTTIAFLRPISSLTHALDHLIWPSSALGMHLHSVAWFGLLLWLAAKLYAELLDERWVAGVAAAMFAFDSGHGIAVGWISNRNALVAGVFAIASLRLHHRWRTGRRQSAVLAWSCFGLSLFSSELAVGAFGYLVAYALVFERGPLAPRLRSLLPYFAFGTVWLAVRYAAHYGVSGLGGYIDPVKEPLAFAQVLPSRPVVLVASQIARLSSDVYTLAPSSTQAWLLACAIGLCAITAVFVWPSLRAQRSSRFWLAGALLSALPLSAGEPSDRLLILVGLGIMPVLAHAMYDALHAAAGSARAGALAARRAAAAWFASVHLVLDPVLLPLLALSPAQLASGVTSADATLPDASSLGQQTVIVADVPDSMLLTYLGMMRSVEGRARPHKLYWLLATSSPARFERRGPHSLRVTAKSGVFDHWEERSERKPLRRGESIRLSEMTITVIDVTRDGKPAVVDFEFARPLDSPSYLWMTWRRNRLQALKLPDEGQSETLCSGS